ncbi:hypothetical protein LTR05_004646 [Lithohypha guttulata]|uniref:Uncharacterized protein n=1 Tax=Lithohypha guttulata TaxID=1690604 RepID=A0AAN7SZ36_9EURO|nr:hypothetical protein LTR05_004646 [Lithohypha guttulata]
MCFYARKDFACGDWRWGNMMERCPRQHRIGETCGAKLVHHDYLERRSEPCKVCQEIEVKKRRLQKTCENISRWSPQRDTFAALLEKAENEKDELVEKIKQLNSQREAVKAKLSGDRAMAPIDPPMATMDRGSYTWSPQAGARTYPSSTQMTSGYTTPTNLAGRSSGTSVSYSPYSTDRNNDKSRRGGR